MECKRSFILTIVRHCCGHLFNILRFAAQHEDCCFYCDRGWQKQKKKKLKITFPFVIHSQVDFISFHSTRKNSIPSNIPSPIEFSFPVFTSETKALIEKHACIGWWSLKIEQNNSIFDAKNGYNLTMMKIEINESYAVQHKRQFKPTDTDTDRDGKPK